MTHSRKGEQLKAHSRVERRAQLTLLVRFRVLEARVTLHGDLFPPVSGGDSGLALRLFPGVRACERVRPPLPLVRTACL